MRIFTLIVSLALAFAAGALGSYFTMPSVGTWYATLAKAPLNPPSWVFAPVWTALYVLMAVAAWRVWQRRAASPRAGLALALYGVQLLLNALWSIVFFGLHNPFAAFIVILALLAAIIATARLFFRIDRIAGWLFVPYLVWVAFATYLNLMVAFLNP